MLFSFSFYTSMLLIFFVHGLVYAILLWRKAAVNDEVADKWLSIFLVLSVLYISPWMLGFAGWYDNQPYRDILFYTPFQHLYFIGPVIFFYLQSLLNPSFHFTRRDWWHFLPGIGYLFYALVIVVIDKLVLKEYFFLANMQDPDFEDWYQVTGFISMLLYFLASIRYYNRYKKLMVQVVSNADVVVFNWVRNFLVAFFTILVIRTFFMVLSIFIELDYWNTWWHFLAFGVCFYYIAITGYANSVRTRMSFRANILSGNVAALLVHNPAAPVEEAEFIELPVEKVEKPGDDEFILQWRDRILESVQHKKAYESPELTLTDLARRMQTNPSVLSKAINKSFGMNFNDFINFYRVQAVITMLKAGEQKRQTLLGIAYDCGFNSKATFNRAFKKVTGKSPKEWLESDS